MNINIVIIGGNICSDVELRYTPKGQAVCDLRLATNRKWKTEQGEEKEETCFCTVVAWGKLAELCAKYLKKGSGCIAEGRLKYAEWTSKDGTGAKRNGLKVEANRVHFTGGKPAAEGVQDHPKDTPQPDAEEERDIQF